MTILVQHYTTTVGPIEITVATSPYPPWNVDVIVEEEDTSLLLGGTHTVSDTDEGYTALIDKMRGQKPLVPGQVLIRHTTPRKFIAVVYDIARRPVYREEWIAIALENLLRGMETYHARNIAMPLLGVTHGHYPAGDFIKLFHALLSPVRTGYPEKIWLITPAPECQHIITCLENISRARARPKMCD